MHPIVPGFVPLLLVLLALHFLCDFPLQGTFLSMAKAGEAPSVPVWYALLAHAMIQAGTVLLATGSVFLCLMELLCHFMADYAKVRGKSSFLGDQVYHLLCRVAWAIVVVACHPW